LARRRYQKGSLHLIGNQWKARWREDVIGPEGSLQRVRRQACFPRAQFPTKKLAQRQFDLVLARINDLGYRPGRIAGFETFIERWKAEVLVQREVSTQRAALWHLRRYLVPAFRGFTIDQIGQEQAQMLISSLAGRVSAKTAVNIMGTLSTILKTAKSWGYTASELNWKELTMPRRTERPRRRFFSAEQAAMIINRARDRWPDEPWWLLFQLAAMTGMREGEILGLKWTDIDFSAKLIFVRRKVWYGHVGAPKTVTSERVLPLPQSLASGLRAYLDRWTPNRDNWLFATRTGKPVMPQHVVQRKLWQVLDDLKIPRCGLHAFRHTHASMLVDAGAPMTVARDQLGHTDMRLTLAVYSHVISDAQRTAVDQLAARLDADGRAPEHNNSYIN
jgi:integrase